MSSLFHTYIALGKDKKPIILRKFRTMCLGAEEMYVSLALEGLDSLGKIKNDPRITKYGAFLRKYWIDELPQLYGVAKGDLKLVGLRPRTQDAWNNFPKEIFEEAMKQKPGFMGVSYAFEKTENFKDQVKNIETYLNQWNTNPIETDRLYFSKIVNNILFNGVRSS